MSKLIRLIDLANEVQLQDINDKYSISQVMKHYDDRQKMARICVKKIFISLHDKVFKLNEL